MVREKTSFEFAIDNDEAVRQISETLNKVHTLRDQVIDQAIQGDGPVPRQLDVFKNDMDYACERLVLRWEIREKLMIDTEIGELV